VLARDHGLRIVQRERLRFDLAPHDSGERRQDLEPQERAGILGPVRSGASPSPAS
jgi:hypothetical protein